MNILKRSFYARSTILVAQDLIGKLLVRSWENNILSGFIVETEAYCGLDDPASHAYKGPTSRNKTMFGPPGHSYVYFVYGNHYCLNIVAKENNVAAGSVLLRDIIPYAGIPEMQILRHSNTITNLTNGPGKIGQAFHLTLVDNDSDVTKKNGLYITEGIDIEPHSIIATPRIGISNAQDKLWRFMLKKNLSK